MQKKKVKEFQVVVFLERDCIYEFKNFKTAPEEYEETMRDIGDFIKDSFAKGFPHKIEITQWDR